MASLNKVLIIGNLGADPDIRATAAGSTVASLSVATTDRWKDKESGEKKEKTEWHRVIAFGKLAENCREFLHKGSQVHVEGKLQTRSWEDKDGNKRWTTEVIARGVLSLDRKGNGQQSGPDSAGNYPDPEPDYDGPDEDVPF